MGDNGANGEQRSDIERRLRETERLVHVGSWSWDVPANAVTWSDELYRIYGIDPVAFQASYEGFLDRVHPDDRDLVDATVRDSLRSKQPFYFEHRIVRPDGSVRWLQARGEVATDLQGGVARMFGIAQDVTESRGAREALAASEHRFRTLLESAPDAVISIKADGVIAHVNQRTTELFGYEDDELIGRPLEDLLPPRFRDAHIDHRAGYMHDPRTRPMGEGLDLYGMRKDGTEFPVDISLSAIHTDGVSVTAFVRDVTERKQIERAARELREASARRRQAIEINDGVVQGLTTAIWGLEQGDARTALRALQQTLSTAREMIGSLFGETAIPDAGDLIRGHAAEVVAKETPPAAGSDRAPSSAITVLIADDTPDIRLLLRTILSPSQGFIILGEASNGEEAVALAAEHRPDIVLLDLAMPVMDGLQATPQILERSPASKVVVLSGYGKEQMAEGALEAGAVAYLEKGGAIRRLSGLLRQLVPDKGERGGVAPEPESARPIGDELEADALSMYVHEMRTPLTALRGLAETLRDRMDEMPSALVGELVQAMVRNSEQLSTLIDALSDARRLGTTELSIVLEPTDIGDLVSEAVSDLREVLGGRAVRVYVADTVVAPVDRFRMRQVVTNLITNAVKFSGPGSPIEVTVEHEGGAGRIVVVDHGRGISAQDRERLFGKFERLRAHAPGVGLGLYIARGIARAHGGDIELAHSSDEGSTFVVTFPLAAVRSERRSGGSAG